MSTINGKILTENWGDTLQKYGLGNLYEDYHEQLDAQAWMCGRNTFEIDFTEGAKPDLISPPRPVSRTVHNVGYKTDNFAIAIDPKGKLGFQQDNIDGDAIISILSEQVSDDYLYFLQKKNISYIVSGKDQVDFNQAFEILYSQFGIERILLEGGGSINGSIFESGLLDELSLIVLPIVDSTPNTPTFFELTQDIGKRPTAMMELLKVEQLQKGALYLNYRIK